MTTKRFNEGTNVVVTVNFRSDGVATVPANVYWTLRNLTAGTTVVDWTAVTAGSTVSIDIDAQYLAIVDDDNDRELQELTVAANYGLPGQVPETIRWNVVNLGSL